MKVGALRSESVEGIFGRVGVDIEQLGTMSPPWRQVYDIRRKSEGQAASGRLLDRQSVLPEAQSKIAMLSLSDLIRGRGVRIS